MVVVAQACRDVVVGGDVVFLLVTSVGIHVTKEDMDLLGRERTLVGELMEEFFCVGPLGEMSHHQHDGEFRRNHCASRRLDP